MLDDLVHVPTARATAMKQVADPASYRSDFKRKLSFGALALLMGAALWAGLFHLGFSQALDAVRTIKDQSVTIGATQNISAKLASADTNLADGLLVGDDARAPYVAALIADIQSVEDAALSGAVELSIGNDEVHRFSRGLVEFQHLAEQALATGGPRSLEFARAADQAMQGKVMPAAESMAQIYHSRMIRAGGERLIGGGNLIFAAAALSLALLAGLVVYQRSMFKHTGRMFNAAILSASAAVIAFSLYAEISLAVAEKDELVASNSFSTIENLSRQKTLASRINATKSFTLLLPDNSKSANRFYALVGKMPSPEAAVADLSSRNYDAEGRVNAAWDNFIRSAAKAVDHRLNERFGDALQQNFGDAKGEVKQNFAEFTDSVDMAVRLKQNALTRAIADGEARTGETAQIFTLVVWLLVSGLLIYGAWQRLREYEA